MKHLLSLLLVAGTLAQVCTEGMKGDGHCDQGCMTSTSNYDSSLAGTSDCRDKCLSHCAAVDLDAGNCKTECLTWDCAWGGGVCGECAAGCPIVQVGNGLCEEACNVQVCSFDAGDCIVSSSPHEVFVSSTAATVGDGRWMTPFNSLSSALESLWLPYNTVYLLSGSHSLRPGSSAVLLVNDLLKKTTLSTLFCTLQSGDHPECATSRASIQVTAQFTSFSISHEVVFESVIFQGNFPLKTSCSLSTCLYCPYVTLDTAHGVYRNDREEEINLVDYAAQSLCDFYHDKSFIVVKSTGQLIISNSLFTSFRQQLKALIWSECGDIQLQSVNFHNCIPSPQGLKGGLIGQTCPDENAPYYCGRFSYITGTVSHLNDGYEYRTDIVTSGFLVADGLNAFLVESVTFEYNWLPVGELVTTMDSSMVMLERFRTAVLRDCVFRYNVASLSVGLTVINSFQFPIILDSNNVATEHQLHHVILSGLTFYNNTSETGTLLYIQFHTNHQNIVMTHCRFTNNFSTKGALIYVQNDQLLARYQDGAYIGMMVNKVATEVWVSPRYVNITNVDFEANYAQSVALLAEIGNVVLMDVQVRQTGESLRQYTALDYIIQVYISLQSVYVSEKSLAFPAAFGCENAVIISSVMQISIENIIFEHGYCPHGSPGITLIGSPTILLFHTLLFAHNTGSELLSFTVNTTIQLSSLTFTNNTNHANSNSVCLNVEFTQPANIAITSSQFTGNQGETGAVGTIFHAQKVEIYDVLIEKNTAKYSGAGLMLSPNAYEFSEFSFKKCVFRGNAADSKGVLTVLDFYGVLSDNFAAIVTLIIEDCQFLDNLSTSQGAAITIYDFIQLSPTSHISNCRFQNNSCDTGASVYLTYQTGITTISSCTFEGNFSPNGGAGVYANQFPDSLEHPTYVLVKECAFRRNRGPSVAIDGKLVQNELIGNLNVFEGNYDSAVLIRAGLYIDKESIYRHNSAEYGAGIYLKLYSAAQIEDSVFDGNVASVDGGAIYSRFFCPAEFTNCTFRNNIGQFGGVVFADTTLGMKFDTCQMSNNTALVSGSAMYSFAGSVYFSSTQVVANAAYQYSLFVMLEAYAEIRNCTVDSNTAVDRTSGILMTSSTLYIYDSRFTNQTSKNGGFILSLNNNELHINGSTFSLGTALHDGGAIYITLDSQLLISYSRFYNCSARLLGGALFSTKSATVVTHVDFFNTSSRSGGAIDITDGTGQISGCRFENYTGGAVHAETAETLIIANSSFSRGVGVSYRGAGLYIVDVMQVNITNCTFTANRANRGGGAYFYSTAQEGAVNHYRVFGNRFEGNSAPSGGALESDGVNLIAANNTFFNNSAYYVPGALLTTNGVGGALVLRCDNPLKCDITVANNTFQRNSARIDGGAVHWQEAPPVFLNNYFEGNTAEYGDDIASFPIALAPVSAFLERNSYQDNSTTVPIAFTLDNFVSGQVYTNTLRFGLFDHLWRLVETANSSAIELEVEENTTLSGQFKGSSHAGVFEMSNFAVIAEPGTTRTIYFTTNGVESSKKSLYNDSARYISTIAVQVNFRLCLPGETLSNGACVVCQAETYSLDPKSPCKTCLSAALCYGGFTMVPRAGYWRARNDSETFFECLNAEACIGSPAPPLVSLTGICADGYMGNLCQVCIPDFSRTGRSNCAKCPGKTANMSVSALIVIVALCGIALIVSLAIRSATKPRSLMAIYFKIFLNYLQMVVVAASLNLHWPSFVKSFLSTQEMAGGMADQLFSFECLIKDFSFTGSMGMFAAKLLLGALLPLSLMLIALLAWGFLRLIKKVDLLFEKVVASCVVILFIVHPSITKIMFSVYSCMEINPGESWVIADLAEQCWTANHFKTVFFISVPSLSVWVLGLPTIVLGLLIRARLRLHEMSPRVMFSFLYKGYEQKWFYWEFVILYRKIAIVSSSVFLSPMSVRVESLTILAILLIAVYLQLRYQPYNETTLNKLEIKSILVSAVTIYAGLYYDTRSMSNSHIGQVINMLLFILIIVTNAYFLVTWLVYISPVIFATLREKWTFLAKFGKPYRVRPLQPSTMGLKDHDKSDQSSSSIAMVSSSPFEGTIPHTETISPPANTPTRLERENTDKEDPGLNQEFSIR